MDTVALCEAASEPQSSVTSKSRADLSSSVLIIIIFFSQSGLPLRCGSHEPLKAVSVIFARI